MFLITGKYWKLVTLKKMVNNILTNLIIVEQGDVVGVRIGKLKALALQELGMPGFW